MHLVPLSRYQAKWDFALMSSWYSAGYDWPVSYGKGYGRRRGCWSGNAVGGRRGRRGGGENVGDSGPSLPPADNVQRRGVRPLLARAVWSAQSTGDERKWRGYWGDCGGRRADVTVRPLFLCSWLLSVLVHAWTERLFVVWLK